jgi:hypothetical protein
MRVGSSAGTHHAAREPERTFNANATHATRRPRHSPTALTSGGWEAEFGRPAAAPKIAPLRSFVAGA